MGYPMTYRRVVMRNGLLEGGYANTPDQLSMLCGDLRRLEIDQRDELHLAYYAQRAGITPEQVKAVLDVFFGEEA